MYRRRRVDFTQAKAPVAREAVQRMSLIITILIGFLPTIALTALLIGLPCLIMKRKSRRLTDSLDDELPGLPALSGLQRGLQLTTVLANLDEVLLGYRTSTAPATSRRSSTDVSPSATGTLLLSLGADPEAALSMLDSWCQEGAELALRPSIDGDVVVLCEQRTTRRLVLTPL
jgi:hypothetical protein